MRVRTTTRGRIRRPLIGTAALTLSVLVAVPFAFAADEVGFELDTDTVRQGSEASAVDWEDLVVPDGGGDATIDPNLSLPLVGSGDEGSISISAVGADADHALPDTTTFTTGSKDTLDINPGWECSQSNNVSNKVDLLNVYSAAGYVGDELHLFFGMERSSNNGDANIAMWFLLDETVGCEASGPGGGGTETFTGNHQNGDILLVSAFTNGGTQANVTAYIWVDGALVAFESGANCDQGTPNQTLCALANDDAVDTPWHSPTSDKSDDDVLAANQFYEGGINLTAALGAAVAEGTLTEAPADQCFATFLGNTRSSTSLTATLFDYSGGSLPVCGGLNVNKYLDVDESGSADTSAGTVDLFSQSDITSVLTGGADEFGSDTDLAGWAIEVYATNGTTDTGDDDLVCSGTTDVDGNLSCTTGSLANLLPGDYRIVETSVPTDWQNTDQATGDGKIVTVGLGGDSQAYVGNTCLVAVEFEVTGIPTDATAPSSMTAAWEVTAGPNLGDTGTETMTISSATATGTTSNQFSISDTVAWDFYVDGDTTETQEGSSGVSLASDGYPDCLTESTQAYPNVDLLGFKYKDMDADGQHDAGEPGLGGWTFELFAGDADVTQDTPLQTVVSSSDGATLGEYTFTDVAPGSYKVVETVEANWVQSGPLDADDAVVTEVAVTVPFDATSDVSIDDIGNTPLSRVSMEFEDLTGSTDATIDCDWTTEEPDDTDPDTDTVGQSQETANVEASDLKIGTYTCTVVITDP